MRKPEDVPQNMFNMGAKVTGEYLSWLNHGNSTGNLSEHAATALADTIARAIMAAEKRGEDREREACAEVVRKLIPNIGQDGPDNAAHEAEYSALGFAMTSIRNRTAS